MLSAISLKNNYKGREKEVQRYGCSITSLGWAKGGVSKGPRQAGCGFWFLLLFKTLNLNIFLLVEDQELSLGADQISPLYLVAAPACKEWELA